LHTSFQISFYNLKLRRIFEVKREDGVVGIVGCVGINPKFARECSIGSPKVHEAVMGKSKDIWDSEMVIE
jgi:hypothetical protein